MWSYWLGQSEQERLDLSLAFGQASQVLSFHAGQILTVELTRDEVANLHDLPQVDAMLNTKQLAQV